MPGLFVTSFAAVALLELGHIVTPFLKVFEGHAPQPLGIDGGRRVGSLCFCPLHARACGKPHRQNPTSAISEAAMMWLSRSVRLVTGLRSRDCGITAMNWVTIA
jgi:hypothetical protein